MKRGNRHNSYERGGQLELAKAMGSVAKKGDKEIKEGRSDIKKIRKDISNSEKEITNHKKGIDEQKALINKKDTRIKEIKKDLGGVFKTVQDANKQKLKFSQGGVTYVNDDFPELFESTEYIVNGTYGSNQTPTEIYVKELSDGGKWYAARDSKNINYTTDGIYEGVDIEEIQDSETISASKPVQDNFDLEDIIVRHYGDMLEERGDDFYEKGGVFAEGRVILSDGKGVGGNKNKTYQLIKFDYDDGTGDVGFEVREMPTNLLMAQGTGFEDVSNTFNLFTGKTKYAKGGEVGKTYSIRGVGVYYTEDSYEEGELEEFHSYFLNSSEFPYETKFSNKKDLFNTINEFISYADLKESDFFINDDTIQASALVKFKKDSNWDEFSSPTKEEIELWKKGKMKLYSAQFVFEYEVYKKEKLEFAKGGGVDRKKFKAEKISDETFNSVSEELGVPMDALKEYVESRIRKGKHITKKNIFDVVEQHYVGEYDSDDEMSDDIKLEKFDSRDYGVYGYNSYFTEFDTTMMEKGGEITFSDGYTFKEVTKEYAKKNWYKEEIYGLNLDEESEGLIDEKGKIEDFDTFGMENHRFQYNKKSFAKGGVTEERVYAVEMYAPMYEGSGFFTQNQFQKYANDLSDDEFTQEAEEQGLIWSSTDSFINSNEFNDSGSNLIFRVIPVEMRMAKKYVNPMLLEKGGEIYKKGDKVLLQEGNRQKSAEVVSDGMDSKGRVRVRPQGFPMDMSISTIPNDRVYIIEKFEKGGDVKGGYVWVETDDPEDNPDFMKDKSEVMEALEDFNEAFEENYKTIEEFNKNEEYRKIMTNLEYEKFLKSYDKGGDVAKKGNEMIIGGIAGILLGIFLNK